MVGDDDELSLFLLGLAIPACLSRGFFGHRLTIDSIAPAGSNIKC